MIEEFSPKQFYDQLSPRYESASESYWAKYGARTVERASLAPGERVLDVASGTGSSALPAARCVSPDGTVLAVDASARMLAIVRQKAQQAQLGNICFLVEDMQRIDCLKERFDCVVCVFGLFFAEDMEALVAKLWGLVRPGGRLAVTIFGTGFLAPVYSRWKSAIERLSPGLRVELPWGRIDERSVAEVLHRGGVDQIDVTIEDDRILLDDPEEWWNIVTRSGLARYLTELDSSQRQLVREANLGWLRQNRVTELDVRVVYATAVRSTAALDRQHAPPIRGQQTRHRSR